MKPVDLCIGIAVREGGYEVATLEAAGRRRPARCTALGDSAQRCDAQACPDAPK